MLGFHSYVSYDGSKIRYLKIGDDKKKKLFVIHGILGNVYSMLAQSLPLLKDYQLIILELRGHGTSEHKSLHEPMAFDCIRHDFDILFKKELSEGERADVVAWSFGAGAFVRYADMYEPKWVDTFINVDHPLFPGGAEMSEGRPKHMKFFTDDYEEFYSYGQYIDNWMNDNKHFFDSYLGNASGDLHKRAIDLHNILTTRAFRHGISDRFPFIKLFPVNDIIMWCGTSFYYKWKTYNRMGASYFKMTDPDYFIAPMRKLSETTRIVFFVGKANTTFPYEMQMADILLHFPDCKTVIFVKSGHDLVFNEPLKYIRHLKEELKGG